MDPDAAEIRVLGCLIEKQRTTPDAYPLSLNALRSACNQTTNRDPVAFYEESDVAAALRRLAQRGWTRLASGAGSRARKYRHLLPEAIDVDPSETALLAVLMLRGPQTPGELKQRSERLHGFESLDAVHTTLDRLVTRGLAARHPRRPGQKEDRYEQLLGGGGDAAAEEPLAPGADRDAGDAADAGPAAVGPAGEDRLERMQRELAELRAEVTSLRESLGDSPD